MSGDFNIRQLDASFGNFQHSCEICEQLCGKEDRKTCISPFIKLEGRRIYEAYCRIFSLEINPPYNS